MVTVASEVTVPRALRLIPMSPFPIGSGTIDTAPALRPPPEGCRAGSCRFHQTTPATSNTATKGHARRLPHPRLVVFFVSTGDASLRGLRGWFMNGPSQRFYRVECPGRIIALV